ncbi:uncharacterized protein DUF5004 [Mariniflexile fucanivorans]|uniref:Uncharacterized protein DUF5004 n=1 Tax=Mariniflexile fucanivorans TaxID=264023 RepID=A0A4R1RNG3_9FLAO|nr:DUF5004 domain-containing protein [Mariniflexile fucanivorans]TCL67689.1 uncharacterized protein DUF5004 [Mariniflexile fucanivorans]
MKKTILLVKSLLLVGILSVSCNNDNGSDCPDALKGELNTAETEFAGTWKLKDIIADEAIDLTDDDVDNPSTDIFSQSSDCQNDLVYNFMTDRDYTLTQGENVTDCDDLESVGTWALSGSTLTLVAYCTTQSTVLTISEDDTEFTYSANLNFKDVNDAVITSSVIFTYEKELP